MVYIKPLKIKFGEITRRLNVRVNISDNIPDLDIKRLRAKIFEFFNFAKDAKITLTYIDGDGDTLSLVNTDDVRDVIWPDKCRKIYVHLTSEKKTQSPHSSTKSVKVQHGEVVRRFDVRFCAETNSVVELDFAGLRRKIFQIFNISKDYEVSLTYIDEDGDRLQLDNDDDLRHLVIMTQNKCKIYVKAFDDVTDPYLFL